jgi:hypothetical protein
LLEPADLDAGRGPSTTARVRGRIERSDTIQRVQEQLDEFQSDTTATQQLAGRQRGGGDSGGGSSSPDAPSDFDPARSEVLEGSPRDQLSGDVTDRARQQRRQNRGTGPQQQSDPGRTRAEPEGARRRQERAQRQEATQEPRTPGRSEAGRRVGEQVGSGVGAGAGVGGLLDDDSQQTIEEALGVGTGSDAAETVEETLGVDVGSGVDAGFETEPFAEFSTELGFETRTETRQDTRQEFGQEIGQEPGTEAGTEIGAEAGTEIGTETRVEQRRETAFGTEFGTETRREIELDFGNDADDDRALEGFGETSDTFDTGFATSEEIAGFGGGGGDLEDAEEELFGNSGGSLF